jgi:glycosyltransferase involved in cell wall biosynthesis
VDLAPSPRGISVIVPAFNEEAVLGRTLDAIKDAVRGLDLPHEVIVVDDASTDRTAAIAAERGCRVVPVRLRQISAVRNAGARASSGDVLIFVDADTVVNGDTMRAALEEIRRGAVGGGARVVFDRIPLRYALGTRLFTFCYFGLGIAAGCFVFARREAFEAVGGFDETLFASEEVRFSLRLRKLGRFVILRPPVLTSGRKMRTYGTLQILGPLLRIALRGPGALRKREGLGIWYEGRREAAPGDPQAPPEHSDPSDQSLTDFRDGPNPGRSPDSGHP